jgi:ribosomal protein S3
MPELISTLTLFAKYLEPQPLADNLAKIIGQTKRHADALKTVENVLRTLNFKRAVGYRISLIGRINGANKSRAIYLTKFKRNRPSQNFSRKVNFAMAQARAQIGTFGIRI